MLQLIDAKFPPKGLSICFHLCYLVANSSDSQHYTSETHNALPRRKKKWLSLAESAAFHVTLLYCKTPGAQFRTVKISGKVWCIRTEYTYRQNAFLC